MGQPKEGQARIIIRICRLLWLLPGIRYSDHGPTRRRVFVTDLSVNSLLTEEIVGGIRCNVDLRTCVLPEKAKYIAGVWGGMVLVHDAK